jgi:hypothetical protein
MLAWRASLERELIPTVLQPAAADAGSINWGDVAVTQYRNAFRSRRLRADAVIEASSG